jgi:inorganic pyrophosphatase
MPELFWSRLDLLVASCGIIIDRPRGSPHPRYADFVYPLDYGYLRDTMAPDGGGIDVWQGSIASDTSLVTGLIFNVDLVKRETEIKLLLDCTQADMQQILEIHNTGEQSAILIVRGS